MTIDSEKLFFIVGTGRCGTTLLQAMLSSHPNIYIPPELRYFGRHDPSVAFSDPLRDEDVEEYLRRCRIDIWWQDMGMDLAAFEDAVRGGVRSGREIFLWLLAHICAERGGLKQRIGEKSPYNGMMMPRIRDLFPRAKFIHIYRDPRDVTTSYLAQYWCTDRNGFRCAGYIKHFLRHLSDLRAQLPKDLLHEIRYESLVREPQAALRSVCAFLGEEYDASMLDYGSREDPGYLAVEEEWKGLTREPLTTSRIGKWREQLSPRQVWTIERLLGSLLERYGYEPARLESRLSWRVRFWTERIYRKLMRMLGYRKNILDEELVLQERNALKGIDSSADGRIPHTG